MHGDQMPIPSGRPNNVIDAIRKGLNGRTVWPRAVADPKEANYQNLAVTYGYIAEVTEGFVLTDLGRRETMQGQLTPQTN
jgi:hypothetical protein